MCPENGTVPQKFFLKELMIRHVLSAGAWSENYKAQEKKDGGSLCLRF